MAGKNKKTKLILKPALKKEHFEVLLENMNDNIQLIAEGQDMFRQVVERRFDESDKRFFEFQNETNANFQELFAFRNETRTNFQELFEFKNETRANFKQVLTCLMKMEDELTDIKSRLNQIDETKMNKKEFIILESRVMKLEQELEQYKSLLKTQK